MFNGHPHMRIGWELRVRNCDQSSYPAHIRTPPAPDTPWLIEAPSRKHDILTCCTKVFLTTEVIGRDNVPLKTLLKTDISPAIWQTSRYFGKKPRVNDHGI